jgi:hypothetical protein
MNLKWLLIAQINYDFEKLGEDIFVCQIIISCLICSFDRPGDLPVSVLPSSDGHGISNTIPLLKKSLRGINTR